MRRTPWAFAFALLTLAGCSAGIKPDGTSPSETFTVATTYQEAFRRAENYARTCHTSRSILRGSFEVTSNLYTDNKTGVVHVTAGRIGTDLERIDVAAQGDHATAVTVTVWGTGIWGQGEMDAAKYSVQWGKPMCH